MSWTPNNEMAVGTVSVVTTSGEGHPPEFYAQRIVDRLIFVGDKAPEPIKAQAQAYKSQIFSIVLSGLKSAIADDRAYRK